MRFTVCCVLLFVGCLGRGEAAYKRWLKNTDWENPLNWNVQRSPCGNDRVIVPDDSPVVYMQTNTTIQELTLPKNGEIIFGNNIQLAFSQAPSADCPSAQGDLEFIAVHPQSWTDPNNWCTAATEEADCQPASPVDTENVPCVTDDVVFLRNRSYYVTLNQGLQLNVKSLKITGTYFTTSTFASFLNSTDGRKMFKPSSSDAVTSLAILRQSCDHVGGCACGNDQGQSWGRSGDCVHGCVVALHSNDYRSAGILHEQQQRHRHADCTPEAHNFCVQIQQEICTIEKKRCKRALCRQAVTPVGACCSMCGAVLNGTRGQGFSLNSFKNKLASFLNTFPNVTSAVSITSSGYLQLVLTDSRDGTDSKTLALRIKEDIDDDLRKGGHGYALDSISLSAESGASASAHTGENDTSGLKGGSVAGIIIGILVFIILVTIIFFIYRNGRLDLSVIASWPNWRGVSQRFSRFKNPHEGSSDRSATAIRMSAIQHDSGFPNPLYDTAPFDDTTSHGMDFVSPMEEQPTFETGINNPLYGTTPGVFFTNASETTIEVGPNDPKQSKA